MSHCGLFTSCNKMKQERRESWQGLQMEEKLSNLHKKLEDFNLKLQTQRKGDQKIQSEIADVLQQIKLTDANFSDKSKTIHLLSDIIQTLKALFHFSPSQQIIFEDPAADKSQVHTFKVSCGKEDNYRNIPDNDTTNIHRVTGASNVITDGDWSGDETPSESTSGFDKVRRANAVQCIANKVWRWMNHKDFDSAENPYSSVRLSVDLPTSQPKRIDPVSNRRPLSLSKSELTHSELHSKDTRTPKRARTPSPRRLKRFKEQILRQDFRVVFSRSSLSKREREIVENLGGTVVESVENATVLVAGKLLRTIKILLAVARGVPIVGHNWLEASKKADKFLDPWEYLLQDPEGEGRYAFNLKTSLLKSLHRDRPLLDGCSIFVTENVRPPPKEMKAIIVSCGANFIERAPKKNWPNNSFIISCEKDAIAVKRMKNRPTVVSSEWIMRGILKHRFEYEKYELAL